MIIESVTGWAFFLIESLFSGFSLVSLPVNLINVLIDIMKFGAWVIGADLLGLVIGSIGFWLTFKFTAGLVLFIWRLLPLT